jgi:hypothetical protein
MAPEQIMPGSPLPGLTLMVSAAMAAPSAPDGMPEAGLRPKWGCRYQASPHAGDALSSLVDEF